VWWLLGRGQALEGGGLRLGPLGLGRSARTGGARGQHLSSAFDRRDGVRGRAPTCSAAATVVVLVESHAARFKKKVRTIWLLSVEEGLPVSSWSSLFDYAIRSVCTKSRACGGDRGVDVKLRIRCVQVAAGLVMGSVWWARKRTAVCLWIEAGGVTLGHARSQISISPKRAALIRQPTHTTQAHYTGTFTEERSSNTPQQCRRRSSPPRPSAASSSSRARPATTSPPSPNPAPRPHPSPR